MQDSKIRLMFLIGVHIFSRDDIKLNSEVFNWRYHIEPVFEESEVVSYSIFNRVWHDAGTYPDLFIISRWYSLSNE